jgi:trimeric autotransporter adhesin
MKTHTRMLRSVNLGSGAERRRVGECQAGAGSLGGAEGASHALKTAYWTLAVVLALSSSWVHAQTPTCAALPSPPGCNSVTSDNGENTAMGTGALASLMNSAFNYGFSNTAAGYHALYFNTTGWDNTALGVEALLHNTTGLANTALGQQALASNTTGGSNTASGSGALGQNTTGDSNTAVGYSALVSNTTGGDNTALGLFALSHNNGNFNTASGEDALEFNTTANGNTASGYSALKSNTTGASNSAFGNGALQYNVLGTENTASGAFSLYSNTSGNYNAASGFEALFANTTASNNTASGFRALYFTTTGADNTAIGFRALLSNTTGLNNIAIGANAGYAVTGSNNIDIGSAGSAGESSVIRIGGPSQTAVHIAGITSAHLTGSPVYVSASGQLGVLSSSERYKTEIASMGGSTQKLHELRPVSFHLKSDPKGAVQYGLIAEEVNKIYPELVIRDDAGTIQGVRYDELAPLLLSEVQQQQRELQKQQVAVQALAEQNEVQAAKINNLTQQLAELNDLKQEMLAVLVKLQSKDQLVAQR